MFWYFMLARELQAAAKFQEQFPVISMPRAYASNQGLRYSSLVAHTIAVMQYVRLATSIQNNISINSPYDRTKACHLFWKHAGSRLIC